MKKNYELTVLLTPVLKEKGLSSAINSVEALIKKHDGKVTEMEDEGKQKLAYPIKKYSEAIYVFWKLQLPTEKANSFEADLKIQKGVLRHLLVREEEN